MTPILVATDFSARSALAVSRAAQLAGQTGRPLILLHVLDEDLPARLRDSQKAAAEALLNDEATRLGARWRLETGDVFQSILAAAEVEAAALIVLGAPRRGGLRTLFSGTTAERTIRHASVPVLMALQTANGPYHKTLLACDFSEGSARAAKAVKLLNITGADGPVVLNVFDAPAMLAMAEGQTATSAIQEYILQERGRAEASLDAFLEANGLKGAAKLLKLARATDGRMICAAAKEDGADLIAMGTRGQSGLARLMLGSVTEEVLRLSDIDVLAVPPGQGR